MIVDVITVLEGVALSRQVSADQGLRHLGVSRAEGVVSGAVLLNVAESLLRAAECRSTLEAVGGASGRDTIADLSHVASGSSGLSSADVARRANIAEPVDAAAAVAVGASRHARCALCVGGAGSQKTSGSGLRSVVGRNIAAGQEHRGSMAEANATATVGASSGVGHELGVTISAVEIEVAGAARQVELGHCWSQSEWDGQGSLVVLVAAGDEQIGG